MKGGKLSAQNLKGLLDASYDPKVDKVGDFEIDRGLSSSTSKVYRDPNTGQVVVAHRGTAGISDWGNNAVYALGGKQAYKLTPRYKEAEKVQRKAEKKYGASNVSTIGHSQGGLQSELLGGRSKEIITLNKATLPFESNKNKNQYDVRSERDVVSGLNPFQKKSKKDISIKSKTFNPLTEHSGDVLNRLDKNLTIGQGIYLKGYARIKGGSGKANPKGKPKARDDEDIYGSFDNEAGLAIENGPTAQDRVRNEIENLLQYDGTPAGYFRVFKLKQVLFEMLVREGMYSPEEYDWFMENFYIPPKTPEKPKLKAKDETPQSAQSDSSRKSYDEGSQFNMEDEFSGLGIMRRKRYSRMRGGMMVSPDRFIENRPNILLGAYMRLERLVDRKLAEDITQAQRETLRNTKAYVGTLFPKVKLIMSRSKEMLPILVDYLAELRADADNFLPVKNIEDWNDAVLGAELIREGMPVGRLFGEGIKGF